MLESCPITRSNRIKFISTMTMNYGKSSALAPTKEEKIKFMEQEKENSVRIKSYRCQIKSMLLFNECTDDFYYGK